MNDEPIGIAMVIKHFNEKYLGAKPKRLPHHFHQFQPSGFYRGYAYTFIDESEEDCRRTTTLVRLKDGWHYAVDTAVWTNGPRWEAEMDAFINGLEPEPELGAWNGGVL